MVTRFPHNLLVFPLLVVAGCGGPQRTVIPAPLARVSTCFERVADSLRWQITVSSLTPESVQINAQIPGRWIRYETSPSQTARAVKPPQFDADFSGETHYLVDRQGDSVRTAGRGAPKLTLHRVAPGSTQVASKSLRVAPYREILERCAASTDALP